MHGTDYFQLMAKYNRWMNHKLLAICEEIPEHDRHKDLGAFFRSIHGTLDHIYHGDKTWMEQCNRVSIYAFASHEPFMTRRLPHL